MCCVCLWQHLHKKRTTKSMSDVGHQRFTKSVFYTPPLTQKIKFVWFCWLSKYWTKNEFSECLLRTLVIDILSRMSMLQINGCGRKSNAYSKQAYHIEFAQWCLNVVKKFGIMTDTHDIHVVTFDFKGTRVRCFVSGATDYQMNSS